MKKPASQLALFAGLLAIACIVAAPAVRAADKDDAAARKAKKQADMLRKYDRNGNGKLDPDEEAAMKADMAKAKAEKEKKKKQAETK